MRETKLNQVDVMGARARLCDWKDVGGVINHTVVMMQETKLNRVNATRVEAQQHNRCTQMRYYVDVRDKAQLS